MPISQEPGLEVALDGIMDSIDSGILLLDAGGRVRVVSDRFAQIMGVEARAMMELGTVEALIDSVASRFRHPAEAAARWREHIRRADEASWEEVELARP